MGSRSLPLSAVVVVVAGAAVAGFLFWVWRIVVGLRTQASADIDKLAHAMKERDSTAHLEKERAKLVEDRLREALHAQDPGGCQIARRQVLKFWGNWG